MLIDIQKKTEPSERLLREFFKGSPKEIAIPSMHLVSLARERLRPALVLLACEACGGKVSDAYNAAAAVEILHHYNMIHDDVIDKDLTRGGQLSVHALYGEALAITAGDYLLSKSLEMIGDGLSPQKAVEVGKILARAARLNAEGRALDLIYSKFTDVTEEQFFQMARAKTGAIFSAAAEIGAVIAGADSKKRKALSEFGELFGVILEIKDDLSDISAGSKTPKGRWGRDIIEGKRTLMAIKTLQDPSFRVNLMRYLGDSHATIDEIKDAVEVMRESGSIDYAKKKEGELKVKARQVLGALPNNNARRLLEKLADYSTKIGF